MTVFNLLFSLPADLVNNLVQEFQKVHQQYFLGRWESSQLDGGRFSEAALRVVEYKNTGSYTPLGDQLNRQLIISRSSQNVNIPNSLRFTIPQLAALIMDFRNNRNVAHLGTIIVNEMDSTFVVQATNWIMSELIRLEGHATSDEARKEITKIIERKVPIVEESGERLRVLDPDLTTKNQILVISYKKFPNFISESDILTWVSDKNKGRVRRYLVNLDSQRLIDYHDRSISLTARGLLWVEKNIRFDLVI